MSSSAHLDTLAPPWPNQLPATLTSRPDAQPHHSSNHSSSHSSSRSQDCTFVMGHVDVEGGGHGPQPRLVQQLQLLAKSGGANHLCSDRGWEPATVDKKAELVVHLLSSTGTAAQLLLCVLSSKSRLI